MSKTGNKSWRGNEWRARFSGFLSVCAEGCYKHYVKGLGWVCCKCGA